MALLKQNSKLLSSCLVIMSMSVLASSQPRAKSPYDVPRLTDQFGHVSLDYCFTNLFGGSNVQVSKNGSLATIALDKTTGSGLGSRNLYYYGFFSAAIKLPSGLSPGVVVAFYMSNAAQFPHNHDEVDFELLGHDKTNGWVLQTNIYANGSVSTGREEKFNLWFDPTTQHHHYSILWNNHHIVFLVDNVPVREFPRRRGLSGGVYPSKPMSVYATIWDGSEWATHGGKSPVNYKYAPFVASLTEMELGGCVWDPTAPAPSCAKDSDTRSDPVDGQEYVQLSKQQVMAMDWARRNLLFYSYCKDTKRFKVLPPECL